MSKKSFLTGDTRTKIPCVRGVVNLLKALLILVLLLSVKYIKIFPYNKCIILYIKCIKNRCFLTIFGSLCRNKLPRQKQRKTAEICGNLGSGNWTRTSDIRINSPLFYRLNYARITRHIVYLKSAQVKDFLNILQRKFICRKNPPFEANLASV